MAKSVIKEIIILLLVSLVMILVLGVLLYEYVPISKTLPNEVSYVTPSDIKSEIATDDDDGDVVLSLDGGNGSQEVTQDELNDYKKIQDYKPGKANPFAPEASTTSGNTTTSNSAATNNGSSSSGSTTNNGGSSSTTNGNNGSNGSTSSTSGTISNGSNNSGNAGSSNNNGSSNSSGGTYFQNKGTK